MTTPPTRPRSSNGPGGAVRLVDGEPANVKVTTADDFRLGRPGGVMRIGTGYDLHRLVPGRRLVLAGVEVPFELGLDGHSDADIVCHAVTDAVLGAAAAGDIGRLFPDSDPAWKDADSLGPAPPGGGAALRAAGYAVGNVDVTVVAQRPKLLPHLEAMRANLAARARRRRLVRERQGQDQRGRRQHGPRRVDGLPRRGVALPPGPLSPEPRSLLLMRVRFAPSPTGHLHVGNARTALFNWLLARHHQRHLHPACRGHRSRALDGGIGSGDQGRSPLARARMGRGRGRGRRRRPVPAVGAARALRAAHRAAARWWARLLLLLLARDARGRAPGGAGRRPAAQVPRAAADRSPWPTPAPGAVAGERPAVRLRVPSGREVAFDDLVRGRVAFHTEVIGDPVIVRGDGVAAYNYAVVIDDALMRITHVVRGEDHISNTPRQILVYEAFGWSPPAFAHLSLVLGPDHAPLSKRHGATSVAEFRGQGLPARGAGQLPGPDRLVARRRGRGAAARRTGPPVRPRRRGPQRRRLRRGQAGLGQSALPQAGRSGSAGGAVPAVSRAATSRCRRTCHRPRRGGCAPSCRRWPRRSTGSTNCPSG